MIPDCPKVNITKSDDIFEVCFHSEEHEGIPVLNYELLVYDFTGEIDFNRRFNNTGSIQCIEVSYASHCAPYTVTVRAHSYQEFSNQTVIVGSDTTGKKHFPQ